MSTQTAEDVIAAFLDDERVDADALTRALALPEGREYLVELLTLRELAGGPPDVREVVPLVPVRHAAPRWRLAVAAAALLSVSTGAGYLAGARMGGRAPAPASQAVTPAGPTPASAPTTSAPAPTVVIKLQPGVDWTEREGGN